MLRLVRSLAVAYALLIVAVLPLAAQSGSVERVRIYGRSLEGNLAGDPAERDVSVYLPPSYHSQPERRYPVVYMLHGFSDSDDKWFGLTPQHWIHLPEAIDGSLAGGAREMIVVMPNGYNRFGGSMYSSSVTIGDWETFIARELVSYVDRRYRTLASRESRGLAGHSMGGYGALRTAMKNPDVFSSIYALNPCCLAAIAAPPTSDAAAAAAPSPAERIRTDEDLERAAFGVRITLASAAAWSPNPDNPPFFIDLPTQDGRWRREIAAKWAANAPLAMLDQYVHNLKRLRAVGLDAGTREPTIAPTTRALNEALMRLGIVPFFEIYEGDHLSRVAERIEKVVMPFFSANLSFDLTPR